MIFLAPDVFAQAVVKPARLLGLDIGTKTIGLAMSDAMWTIASPLKTIARKKFSLDKDQLKTIVSGDAIGGLIIGYPINMNGSEGPRCQSIRQFALNMEVHLPLPMLLWDERLSSAAVERMMKEAEWSREKQKEQVDKLAAAYILQGFLDHAAHL